LLKLTLNLLPTLKGVNPSYAYDPLSYNPKRPLTHPAEPCDNFGYDNADNDYILRVNDIILTPEGRE